MTPRLITKRTRHCLRLVEIGRGNPMEQMKANPQRERGDAWNVGVQPEIVQEPVGAAKSLSGMQKGWL